MGGQNHQPTNRIRLIAPSAWLSRCVGDGFTHVLQANSELENAIIVGMERLHVEQLAGDLPRTAVDYLDTAIEHLRASLEILPGIANAYSNLLEAASLENYQGNPLASQLPAIDLASQFEGGLIAPAINRAAWEELESRIADNNILHTLVWEGSRFAELASPMESLIEVLETCREIAHAEGARAMVEAIECNEVPLRQRFAPVFSRWNHLHAMFLYSALMMTELFYLTNTFGTLNSEERHERAATA